MPVSRDLKCPRDGDTRRAMPDIKPVDVVVVGAGHNGLVAADAAGRAGLKRHRARGEGRRSAARAKTEYPFAQGAAAGHVHRRVPARPHAAGADARSSGCELAAHPPRPALLPAHHRQALPAVRLRRGRDAAAVPRVLLRAGLARQPGDEHARSARCATTSRPRWLRGAAVARGDRRALRPPGAARGLHRPVPRLGRASTSTASASRATCCRRCTR